MAIFWDVGFDPATKIHRGWIKFRGEERQAKRVFGSNVIHLGAKVLRRAVGGPWMVQKDGDLMVINSV